MLKMQPRKREITKKITKKKSPFFFVLLRVLRGFRGSGNVPGVMYDAAP
jgi:hypothetical protein